MTGGGKRGRDTGTKVKRKLPKIRRPRSPSHPNYKEESYLQSKLVLRYEGPGEDARDEVKVHQQPAGTYTLPVFKGILSVGGLIFGAQQEKNIFK